MLFKCRDFLILFTILIVKPHSMPLKRLPAGIFVQMLFILINERLGFIFQYPDNFLCFDPWSKAVALNLLNSIFPFTNSNFLPPLLYRISILLLSRAFAIVVFVIFEIIECVLMLVNHALLRTITFNKKIGLNMGGVCGRTPTRQKSPGPEAVTPSIFSNIYTFFHKITHFKTFFGSCLSIYIIKLRQMCW